jgi:drug/metabolite transporter (DMT)-like permease
MSPLYVGSTRAVIAAVLAAGALALTRQRVPRGVQWGRLAIVAGGVVVGFPLLTSYSLSTVPASHGVVVTALLPTATAVMAVIRGHERPSTSFWVAAGVGAIAAGVFASLQGGGLGRLRLSDVLLFAAVVVCAIGYAEGGLLSRELGSWQTISWALILSSPLMVGLGATSIVVHPPAGTVIQWGALAYLGVVSMFLGFVAWYRGLAIGPIAQIGQVQLAQPALSLCWAALLLREQLTWPTVLGGMAVIGCALLAVRASARSERQRAPGVHAHLDHLYARGPAVAGSRVEAVQAALTKRVRTRFPSPGLVAFCAAGQSAVTRPASTLMRRLVRTVSSIRRS